MSLSVEAEQRLIGCLGKSYNSGIELNRLLWSFDTDELLAACQIAEDHNKPLNAELIATQKEAREKWDPKVVLDALKDTGVLRQFPLASQPLLGLHGESKNAAMYVLLDFSRWVNADPEFILKIMEEIWQNTLEADEKGYARFQYRTNHYWSFPPEHNRGCFVAASLATYTQYPPAICRRVFMPSIHCCAGGYFHLKRIGPKPQDTDSGCFTFWGLTYDAMNAALERQNELSNRIFAGGWE